MKYTNHEQEVQRFATLLRELADRIEDNPQSITWQESHSFETHECGRLNVDFDYYGDIAFLAKQLEELE